MGRSMNRPERYRAFISYAHADVAAAEWLQKALENHRSEAGATERYPLRPVFLDRSELSSAESLPDALTAAIDASDALVVVCSPAAARSRWVDAEISSFRERCSGRVLAWVIDGVV